MRYDDRHLAALREAGTLFSGVHRVIFFGYDGVIQIPHQDFADTFNPKDTNCTEKYKSYLVLQTEVGGTKFEAIFPKDKHDEWEREWSK